MIKSWMIIVIYTLICIFIGAFIMKKVIQSSLITNGCGQYNSKTGDFEYIKK